MSGLSYSNVKSGNRDQYFNAIHNFKKILKSFVNQFPSFLIVYHGDCDGIISAVLICDYLKKHNKKIKLFGVAQFRDKEYDHIIKIRGDNEGIIFLEGYGMSDNYKRLSSISVNIDHHPVVDYITRFINSRKFNIIPNPSNALLTFEILNDDIHKELLQYVVLASIMDYCNDAAEKIIAQVPINKQLLSDLKNTFFAIQYDSELTNKMVFFLLENHGFQDLVNNELFKIRRNKYVQIFKEEVTNAQKNRRDNEPLIIHYLQKSEYRISSSLANQLSESNPDKIIIIVETDNNRARLSVRNRSYDLNIGEYLNKICSCLDNADATGHEKAASARLNINNVDYILHNLKGKIQNG